MFSAWMLSEYVPWMEYGVWWTITIISIYAIVIHPMQVQYQIYKHETEKVMSGTLCSTCKFFEPTGVLCAKLDVHVSEDDIPCEGELWEPRSVDDDE